MSDRDLPVTLNEAERQFLLIACGHIPDDSTRCRPGAGELTGEGVIDLRRRLAAATPRRDRSETFAPAWADIHHMGSPAADIVAVLLTPADYRFAQGLSGRLTGSLDDDGDSCGVCRVALLGGDVCATDVDLGTCHARCLDGAAVVNLRTGEPSDGPVHLYRYDSKPLAGAAVAA